jgi:hypothetical protein
MGGDGTSYYKGALATGGASAACAVLSIIFYLSMGIEVGGADFAAVVVGALGAFAGFKQVRSPPMSSQ